MNIAFKVLVGLAATYAAALTVFTAVFVIAVIRDRHDQAIKHRLTARLRAQAYAQLAYDAQFRAIVRAESQRAHPSAQDDDT